MYDALKPIDDYGRFTLCEGFFVGLGDISLSHLYPVTCSFRHDVRCGLRDSLKCKKIQISTLQHPVDKERKEIQRNGDIATFSLYSEL